MIHFNKTTFLTSSAKPSQFPQDLGKEVAFIGRSNTGKSSAINALTRQKKLARTSKDPGRTQCINFFPIDEERRIADLPGYGFAKVPFEVRKRWQSLIHAYLKNRTSLRGLVLLMDIRHPMTELDIQMLNYAEPLALPVHILLTKADKLTRNAYTAALHQTKKLLGKYGEQCSVQLFSSLSKMGVPELEEKLSQWL